MPKYLLTNVYNYDNQGEMAQVMGLVNNLKGSFAVVPMVSKVDRGFCERLNIQIKGRDKPLPKLLFILWIGSFLIRAKLGIFLNQEIRAYRDCDVVLSMGGDTFSDEQHPLQTILHCCQLLPAIFMNKPYILASQSIGVFKTSFTRKVARYVLSHSKLIIARENITVEYLKSMGIDKNVRCAIDVGLLLEPVKSKACKDYIGVNVSQIIGRWFSSVDEYISLMLDVIMGLAEESKVVLIPHVTGEGYALGKSKVHDDRIMTNLIYSLLPIKDNVEVIDKVYATDETKGIIGSCKYFIGARFHACLAAISQGIPTLVLAYSQKSVGMVNQIDLPWVKVVDVRGKTYSQLQEEIQCLLPK